jgi:hypothetical protein
VDGSFDPDIDIFVSNMVLLEPQSKSNDHGHANQSRKGGASNIVGGARDSGVRWHSNGEAL